MRMYFKWFICAVCVPKIVLAITATWTGGASNNWNNNLNWDTDFPNAAADAAIFSIDTGGAVTLGQDITIGAFTHSSAATLTIATGNTLTFDNDGSNATLVNSNNDLTFNNPISLTSTLEINHSSGTLSFANVASGSGGVTKSGAATAILSGINTYTGATTISAGTLSLSGSGSIASSSGVSVTGTLDISGVTTGATINNLTGSGSVVTTGKTLTVNCSSVSTFSGVISGASGALTKTGASTLALSGTSTYTGATTISEGNLTVFGSNSSPSISIASGSTLTFSPGATQSYSGIISGDGNLVKTNPGTTTLSGINTYTGSSTIISAGALKLSGSGSIANSSSVTIGFSTTLDISGVTTGATINNLTGSGSAVITGKTMTVNSSSDTTFSGAISGTSGALTKTGASTLALSGTNTYTGATTVSAGTLSLSGSGTIANSSSVSVTGTLDISGVTTGATINNLTGSGSAVITGKTMTVNSSSDTTFSGAISGTSGALTKTGASNLTLSGTNTYTGATTVSAGILTVNGAINSGSTTTVASGASLKGTGTTGPVTVSNGGGVTPGNSIGTINVVGNYIQSSGSTLNIEISPTASSKVNVTGGSATIQPGATLNIIPQAGTYSSVTHVFLEADGGLSGTFDTISIDTTEFDGEVTHSINYTDTQGQIILTGILLATMNICDTALIRVASNLAYRMNQIQLGMVTEIQNQRMMGVFYCPKACYSEEFHEDEDDDPYEFISRKKDRPNKEKMLQQKKCRFYRPYILLDYAKDETKAFATQGPAKDKYRSVGAGCDFYFLREFILGGSIGYTNAEGRSGFGCGEVDVNTYNVGLYFQSEFLQDLYLDGAVQGAKSYV